VAIRFKANGGAVARLAGCGRPSGLARRVDDVFEELVDRCVRAAGRGHPDGKIGVISPSE
jgi:hypothetical protein